MKLAFAGKGGAGKTTLAAWTADHLARSGADVWMVDADTALSLGAASGLAPDELPAPLSRREDIIRERIGAGGAIRLTPEVDDLPEQLAVDVPLGGPPAPGVRPGRKRLLVMGTLAHGGDGCACEANALLKALLAHLVLERGGWLIVDLEAGVEHLGRGTAAHVDALAVVSEPSLRGLGVAAQVGRMARELDVGRAALVLNRHPGAAPDLPRLDGLPPLAACVPPLNGLAARMLTSGSVLGLPEQERVDGLVARMLAHLAEQGAGSG